MAGNLGRVLRVTVLAGLVAVLAVTVTGCVSAESWGGHLSSDPALDVNRANWVQESIAHDMSLGALTEASLVRIVSEDGGGYVRQITFTGQRGTFGQQITMDAVLGSTAVHNSPPTGIVNSPDGQDPVECFTFTIGWTDATVDPPVRADCPQTALGSPRVLADREAGEVNSAADLATVLTISAAPVPATRSDALSLLAPARAYALKALSPTLGQDDASHEWDYVTEHLSFASGKALAAAAMPVLGGGCVYVTFDQDSKPGMSVPAWPAPLDALCTGSAALAASGAITDNPQAGG